MARRRTGWGIGLAGTLLVAAASTAQAAGIFAASYSAVFTFQDANPGFTTGVAYDGTEYYSGSGGSNFAPYAHYTSTGALIGTTEPTIDQRSIFSNGAGGVFIRAYADRTIYQQVSFGTFTALLTLTGGPLDDQSAVVFDANGTGYVAHADGVISRWNAAGSFIETVNLAGFSGTEALTPNSRSLAVGGDYWLTYDTDTQTLSAWTPWGARVGTTTLVGAGQSYDSGFGLSFANGMVFIVDFAFETWRGYEVDLPPLSVPEPGSLTLLAGGAALVAARRRRRAD